MSDEISQRSVRIEWPVSPRAPAARRAWRYAGLDAALRAELGRGG